MTYYLEHCVDGHWERLEDCNHRSPSAVKDRFRWLVQSEHLSSPPEPWAFRIVIHTGTVFYTYAGLTRTGRHRWEVTIHGR